MFGYYKILELDDKCLSTFNVGSDEKELKKICMLIATACKIKNS